MSSNSLADLLVVTLTAQFLCISAIPLEEFYPFGQDVGDNLLEGSKAIIDNNLAVNLNGYICYGYSCIDIYFIIPFDDVGGNVWFRNTTTPNTTERVLTDIRRVYPNVTSIVHTIIVTWDRVHVHSQRYKTNTFQVVVATSGNYTTYTYAIYLYADDLMQWTSADGGIRDFGDYLTATVGFYLEYNDTEFYLSSSGSCSIIHIVSRSNVDIQGMFVFALDGTDPIFVSECEEGDIRLVDSNMDTNVSGRVELCLSNEWRIVGDEIWGVEEATVVCRQLGLPTDEVLVGWNLKSAGVPIYCSGNESQLIDCAVYEYMDSIDHRYYYDLKCGGEAATITCLKKDDCKGFLQNPFPETTPLCFNRYGSCVPFSLYLMGNGIPCKSVYESGTDYVYVRNSTQTLEPLGVIGNIEQSSQDDSYCMNSTIQMICHYYLPPCGNSTHFKAPTSVCSDACHLQRQMCPNQWRTFESELSQRKIHPLNCSETLLNHDLLHSCSNLEVYTNLVTVALERKAYQVIEGEGRVEVCATLISTYDVECAVPSDFHMYLTVSNRTAGLGTDYYDDLQTLNFIACEERGCTLISIVDDDIAESEEQFIIHLERAQDLDYRIIPSTKSAEVIITDDDDVNVGISETVYSVGEKDDVAVVCTSILFGTAVGEKLSISYQTANGDAQAPDDYIATNGSFDITDSITVQCISIPIIPDNTTENDECFNYTISTNSTITGLTLSPNLATICITDPQKGNMESAAQTEATVLALVFTVVFCVTIIVAVVVIAIVCQRRAKVLQRNRGWDVTPAYEHHYFVPSKGRQTEILQHMQEQLKDQKMIYSKDQIQLSTTVGEGEYGLVYKGYIKTSIGNELVAIKTVKALFSTGDLEALAKEVSTMLSFKHMHVMSLIGVCIDGEMPLLILPFMSNGNLLNYVRNHKDKLLFTGQFVNEEVELAACRTLLRISLQIAKGMEYLSQHKFVHRDLAARNCMIDAEGVIKVADFGLTEKMSSSYYFCQRKSEAGQEEKVPIRWMAPESIENSVYTEATDVWSYGVTLWEIFTCGRVPYSGIHAMGLLNVLQSGERLNKPDNKACNDDTYGVMLSCWEMEVDERPKFSDLVNTVNDLLERDAGYLELSLSPTCKLATTSPAPSAAQSAHPEIELTEMAVFEPEMEEKEDISDDMQGSSSPSTGSQ